MSRSARERWPISSRRRVKSGISTRILMRRRTTSAESASRRTGPAVVLAGKRERPVMTTGAKPPTFTVPDTADLQDRETLGGDHLVDVVALGREHQGAMDGARAQHGDRDRDDHLAEAVDADHALLLAPQRVGDLLVAHAARRTQFAIEREV